MLKSQLVAEFSPVSLTLDEGFTACATLLNTLSTIQAFAPGWEADGAVLASDQAAFFEVQRRELSREDMEFSSYGIVAESARRMNGQDIEIEQYMAAVTFGGTPRSDRQLRLDFLPKDMTLALARQIVAVCLDWAPLQHLTIMDPYYAMEESPIGLRRTGLGWAGWVPFRPEPAALPEGTLIEPMGRGSFIATQERFWDVPDRAGVKRGQALELALNALGVLPTGADLRDGTWGQGG
ncbi:hypothetical protein FHY55_10615 [Oceanicola sp. D3]|uniref:hypothetical protein n=1 Tax=Oceanicola sp. D3 TaxID=2587163 RepID=UPI001121CBEE|nr:hypothetical protein [Oceanicola sp. D3]QDC09668.1 hypothetical protein FHY55_10615 [Oceanicola sp. D3]